MNICTLNRTLSLSLCFSLSLLIVVASGLTLDIKNNLLYVVDTNNILEAFASNSTSFTPSSPKNLKTSPISPTSVILIWDEPILSKNMTAVTGYKIEYKIGSASYIAITADTKSVTTSFIHQGLDSSKTYTYQVSAINSNGTGNPSSSSSVKPAATTVPGGLTATAINPTQIRLSWQPPSNTFGQSISGYEIKPVFATDVYGDTVGSTNGKTTSYIISNLITDKKYSFVVVANIGYGSTGPSNTASATPLTSSVDVPVTPSSTISTITVSTSPIKLTATSVSSTQINLSWSPPSSDGNSPITGYKIEVKQDSGSNSTLVADTKSTATTYSHTGLITNSKYTYKVYAINSVGTSTASNEVTATPVTTLKLNPLGKLSIDEGKSLSFAVKVTDNSLHGLIFNLDKNPPIGAKINSNTGMFTWTPADSQGAKSYTFDIVVTLGSSTDRQSITITVNDVLNEPEPTPVKEPEPTSEPEPTPELGIALFVDKSKDPQSYVDRYNKEPTYKKWFDTNFPEYSSIYEAVGLDEPKKDPQSYIDRYNKEPTYKKWFDTNFPEYSSIYEAVGLDEPKVEEPKVETPQFGICGTGTKLIDGMCTLIEMPKAKPWWKFW
ncbi:MAG: fibronectin type III domain-containing protein [Nitrosarchaeum sp.]|nr:fibronectin type III domain-containing protein [Nitrosarchaeum sp.]